MARLKCFAVLDSASAAFFPPFFVATEALAVRGFLGALESNAEMKMAPPDFTLHALAEFDNESGILFPLKAPVRVNVPLSPMVK